MTDMMSLKGPLTRLYWRRLPGLVRGRLHSAISRAMKPRPGVRFAGPGQLVHLIEAGEVVPRLGRVAADRLHGAAQIGDDFTDGNQLAALTLHGFILPCSSGQDRDTTHHNQRKRQRNQNRNRMPDSIWSASIGPPPAGAKAIAKAELHALVDPDREPPHDLIGKPGIFVCDCEGSTGKAEEEFAGGEGAELNGDGRGFIVEESSQAEPSIGAHSPLGIAR